MKIQYWGTAAAEGVPGIFCSCEVCKAARIKKGRCIRTRSQLLINDDLLVDFGPDTYAHTLEYDFDLSRLEHVVITHPHEDHFYPDEITNRMPAFSKAPDAPTLIIHGAEETLHAIRNYSRGIKHYKDQKRVLFDIMKPYETREVGGYMVTPLPARHGTESPFNYLIEDGEASLLILNDTGRPAPEFYEYLVSRKIILSAISFDTTYGFKNVLLEHGVADHHMGLLDNVAVREYMILNGIADKNTVCIANHFSHQGVDADYDKMCEHGEDYGFIISYDGMTVEV